MALRAVVKRGNALAWRGWHHYQHDSGILGAININRSIFPHHRPCLSIPRLNHSCRHYYLPPAPLVSFKIDVDLRNVFGSYDVFPVDDLIGEASPIAQFALMTHNETQDRNLRFVRVIRASSTLRCGEHFYLTLEAIDENGELNVYYAEVQILNCKRLLKWELVDESFNYHFLETRVVRIAENVCRNIGSYVNIDAEIMDSAGIVARGTVPCYRDIYEALGLHTTRSPDVLPSDGMIDCGKIFNYAVSALEMLKKKGKEICLEEVLHASKEKVDDRAFYILVLKGTNDKKESSFITAIFEVSESKKEELIKWHVVDELFSGPLKIEETVAEARDIVKHISDDLSRMGKKEQKEKERQAWIS